MKGARPAVSARTARLLADAGHTLGSSLYMLVLGVGISVVLARSLGPEGKGSYDLMWVSGHMFSVLGGLSLSSGLTYYAARRGIDVRAVLGRLAVFTGVLCALAAIMLWLIRGTPFDGFVLPPDATAAAVWGVVLLVGVLTSSEHWRAVAVGSGRVTAANQRDLLREILFLILLGGAVWVGSGIPEVPGHTAAIWAAVAAHLVGGILLFGLVRGTGRDGGGARLAPVLSYSMPAHASNVAQFLNYRLDFFLVSYFAGVSALGHYGVAVGLTQLLWIGSRAASRVLLPAVAGSEAPSGVETALVARLSLWAALCGGILFLLGGRWLIEVLYGAAFLPGHLALVILLVGTVPFTLANTLAAHLGGLGLPRLNLGASLVGLVVTVVLDLLWIPRFGIAGAAAATSASYLASTAVLVFHFARRSSVSLRELVLLRRADLDTALAVARGAAAALRGRAPS